MTFEEMTASVASAMLQTLKYRHRLRVELERQEGDTRTTYTFTVDGGGYQDENRGSGEEPP